MIIINILDKKTVFGDTMVSIEYLKGFKHWDRIRFFQCYHLSDIQYKNVESIANEFFEMNCKIEYMIPNGLSCKYKSLQAERAMKYYNNPYGIDPIKYFGLTKIHN